MNRNVLRSVVAVPSGWAVGVGGCIVTMIVIAFFNHETFKPGAQLPTEWLLVTLAILVIWSVLAGFVVGVIAQRREIEHAIGLVIFTWLLSLYFTARSGNPAQGPSWYVTAGEILGVLSNLLGGWLRLKQRILLERRSKGMIKAMDSGRVVLGTIIATIVFLFVLFWATIVGYEGLSWIVLRLLGEDYFAPIVPPFVAAFVLASFLSQCAFKRIAGVHTSLANGAR